MLWSSPMYNGTISGSFKNALDWLHVLGHRDPPYVHDTVVGLISTAGGTQVYRRSTRWSSSPERRERGPSPSLAERIAAAA